MTAEDPEMTPDAEAPVQLRTMPDGSVDVLVNSEVAAHLRAVDGPSGRAWTASNVAGDSWPARRDAVAAAVRAHRRR
jgi:hypothetical protein